MTFSKCHVALVTAKSNGPTGKRHNAMAASARWLPASGLLYAHDYIIPDSGTGRQLNAPHRRFYLFMSGCRCHRLPPHSSVPLQFRCLLATPS